MSHDMRKTNNVADLRLYFVQTHLVGFVMAWFNEAK